MPGNRVLGIMGKDTVRIGSVVIDVKDFSRMMAFWKAAPGYRPKREPTLEDPFVILKDPQEKAPNVSLDGMDPYRNVLHLNLYTADPDREARRMSNLGATCFRE